jgi:hypothetical protein
MMRKATRNVLVLAVAVVLLGVGIYVELAHEATLAPQGLTTVEPATVRKVEVRCTGCRTRRFERNENGWRMLEPYSLPADVEALARLLAIAHAPVQERHPLRDYDAAKLGLEPPQITLTLDDLVIAVGGEDPIDHDRYIRIGEEMLRVPDRFGARLLESPESELDRHPVPPGSQVVGVSLRGEPAGHDLAAAWQNAVAINVRAAETEGGAGIPVVVNLADGSALSFTVFHAATAYVVRRQDLGIGYLFEEAQARTLLGSAD